MQPQKTYRQTPAKIFFALAFLLSISFFPGAGGNTAPQFQGTTKTEQVFTNKVKTPNWIISLQKKVKYKTLPKSPAVINKKILSLSAYNSLARVKLKNISQLYSSIKSPDTSFPVKTIPQTSKVNDFISFTG